MRIAFTGVRGVPDLYSGSETAVTGIATRLVEKGHDVTVYCRKGYGDESEPTYKGIKKIYMPRIETKQLDTLSHTLFSLIHLFFHPVDVVIVFNAGNGPFCIIPRLRGIKVICNTDGIEWNRKKWGFIAKQYWKFATWCCMKLAHGIVADSRKLQELYKKWFNRDSTYIAYGAYLENSVNPEILEEYGLEPNEYFFVGSRLEPENNADIIVKAFEQVKTDKKLVIAGTANYKSKFIQELHKTQDPRIIFTGGIYTPGHIKELHCGCFAYVHGNEVGGTNPALLKALGYSNCVLYLDAGHRFNTEVVGDAGIPYPKDVDGLRRQMQDLVDNPEKVLTYRKRAPERIKEAYTWDLVADRYEELCIRLHEKK
ncbi:MAG: DUF1972 domain-containing protein [Candidatus Hydrogenedentes bacterium]|nr:DUF1972 domain-containing protein [Candidatus Hydrogenedentota bacterium]